MKLSFKIIWIFFAISIVIISCNKRWLDEKPLKALQIPVSLKDYKALISGTTGGGRFNDNYGTLSEHGAGDFYISDNNYEAASVYDRNFYSWEKDLWAGHINYASWVFPYESILYTNIVLEGVEKIIPQSPAEELDVRQVKGSALFFRACWHFDIARQFCMAYNKSSAATDIGIPLRLTADFNEISVRASVGNSYDQIVADLKHAASLLPVEKPINDVYRCTPTISAAFAMLARVYISMSEFDSALVYADKTLGLYDNLLDYNNVSSSPTETSIAPSSQTPFARFNTEVIFHMRGAKYSIFQQAKLIVDSTLYESYDSNDLRKASFFRVLASGNVTVKGGYDQATNGVWVGVATDEIVLIKAECLARKGNIEGSMNALNSLMIKRWNNSNGSWVPFNSNTADGALRIVLDERRKELLMRGIRWTDLKRLNLDQSTEITLKKRIKGNLISLPPNSPLYIFSIPPHIIELTGMPQNLR